MEKYQRDLNIIADKEAKAKHLAAQRLAKAVDYEAADPAELLQVVKSVLVGIEDKSERCREICVGIVSDSIPRCSVDVLDWVLPSVVARIGIEPVAEPSEEVRLLLLQLAETCLSVFPHDVGPRNFFDFYKVLLENCLKDPFPELKKLSCKVCQQLCSVDPKRITSVALPLAKVVKTTCLHHKHSAVRVEAVNAVAALISNGAVNMLGDNKDEQDNRTTVHYLFVLCSDHSEIVRQAMVEFLSKALLDITERLDQHRRLLPHLIVLLTDASERIRISANSVMLKLGKLHFMDNEDNSIDASKRRITLKDIEWYADEEYPDMNDLTVKTRLDLPDLSKRPFLGSRYVLAESIRHFLGTVLGDITAVDWTIPFSPLSKRIVSLRQLIIMIWYLESNVVQHTQQILQTLYKAIADDDADVRNEAYLCMELLGKFLSPAQYLPFLVAKSVSTPEEEAADATTMKTKTKLVTVVSASDEGKPTALPTLFTTAASSAKASVLVAFKYVLLGSKHRISSGDAIAAVRALSTKELIDLESPALLLALLDTIETCVNVLVSTALIVAPGELPPEIKEDLSQRTLDSMLLYTALSCLSCEDSSVKQRANEVARLMSNAICGDDASLFDAHIGRLLARHLSEMPVAVFGALINGASNIEDFAEPIVSIFVSRLSEVDYTLRVTDELQFFLILENVLKRIRLGAEQIETIVRSVIMPHGAFHPGQTAHLFRKVAIASLALVVSPKHQPAFADICTKEESAVLIEKIVSLWLNAIDGDDMEMRLTCIVMACDICRLPMPAGCAADALQHMMLRLDDSSDQLRLETCKSLRRMFNEALVLGNGGYEALMSEVRGKLTPTVKKMLIHLDDTTDSNGLRDELCMAIKLLKIVDDASVKELTRQALSKHLVKRYCEEILAE